LNFRSVFGYFYLLEGDPDGLPTATSGIADGLRRLQKEANQRGDECLALLLAGIDMYTSIGREWELLEVMRKFAHDAEGMVRDTPTAAELKKLYERDDSGPSAKSWQINFFRQLWANYFKVGNR
jgi:hypothetical protein